MEEWKSYSVGDTVKHGTVIKHCGDPTRSARVGWVGVVVKDWDDTSNNPNYLSDSIFVKWSNNKHGVSFSYGVTQSYSIKWFINNIKFKVEGEESMEGTTSKKNGGLTEYCIAAVISNPQYHKNIKTQVVPEVGILVAKVNDYDLERLSGSLGVICEVTDTGEISVRWILDNNSKVLDMPYTRTYINPGMLHSEISGHFTGSYLTEYRKRGDRVDAVHQSEKAVKEYKRTGQYIVWSPSGNTNPKKIHSSLVEATRVAAVMSDKHNQDLYVCRLVSRSFQKHTKTTLVEDMV